MAKLRHFIHASDAIVTAASTVNDVPNFRIFIHQFEDTPSNLTFCVFDAVLDDLSGDVKKRHSDFNIPKLVPPTSLKTTDTFQIPLTLATKGVHAISVMTWDDNLVKTSPSPFEATFTAKVIFVQVV